MDLAGISIVAVGFLPFGLVSDGWFGPRGLASILFVLLIVEGGDVAGSETIFSAVLVSLMLSIGLHGITAGPGSRWYARAVSQMGECEETKPVSEEPYTNTAT